MAVYLPGACGEVRQDPVAAPAARLVVGHTNTLSPSDSPQPICFC